MQVAIPLASLLLVVNLATFAAFAWDKHRARTYDRRVPESVLLQLAFLGGSPAAKLAQSRFRHKTRKQPFARRLNAIVAFHVALLVGISFLVFTPGDAAAPGFR